MDFLRAGRRVVIHFVPMEEESRISCSLTPTYRRRRIAMRTALIAVVSADRRRRHHHYFMELPTRSPPKRTPVAVGGAAIVPAAVEFVLHIIIDIHLTSPTPCFMQKEVEDHIRRNNDIVPISKRILN
jgi:hypothetical protein